MLTLHGYFARELLKTFLMTAVALTILLVMGGGVANIFRGEGISAEEMVKVFAFLTPVAVTLILPVAALFSAAITYGRAAADNEVLACRAAGINIHKLLLSAALLGLVVTSFTYWAWNYLIPHLSGQIEYMTRKDLLTIVKREFQKARPLSFGKYRITANRCETVDPEGLAEDVPAGHQYLRLLGVCFVEVEDQEPTRYGTADETIIDFDNSETMPRATVDLQGVRAFDAARRQYYQLDHQILGPWEVPNPVKRKIKFETITTLRHYLRHPEDIPEVDRSLQGLKREMMAYLVFRELRGDLDPELGGDGQFNLFGEGVQYEIRVGQFAEDPDDGRLLFKNLRVTEDRDSAKRLLTADSATIKLKSSLDPANPVILLELTGNVEIRRLPMGPDSRVVGKPRESLSPMPCMAQPRLRERMLAFDPASLLQADVPLQLHPRQDKQRLLLINRARHSLCDVQGEIRFRASYSASTVAVVLIGAVLGIIVRGGQALTAFGISCVPMAFVVVAGIVGRNLADRPEYATYSAGIMWGATAFAYIATAVLVWRFLKR